MSLVQFNDIGAYVDRNSTNTPSSVFIFCIIFKHFIKRQIGYCTSPMLAASCGASNPEYLGLS